MTTSVRLFSFITLITLTGILLLTMVLNMRTPWGNNTSNSARNLTPSQIQEGGSHNLKPVASNQWYSNLYVKFPTEPIFASPLAYKLTPAGIVFSYPDITKTPKTVFGSFTEDFTLSNGEQLRKPVIERIDDWSIAVSLPSGENEGLSFTMAKGVPFTLLHTSRDVKISFPNGYTALDNGSATQSAGTTLDTASLAVTTRNHHYILAFPDKRSVSLDNNSITISEPGTVFVGLMAERDNFAEFQSLATTEVTGTYINTEVGETTIDTTYTVKTSGETPLVALFPHHYHHLAAALEPIGTYQTLRGSMQLVRTSQFTTQVSKTVPPETFEPLTKEYSDFEEAIKKDIDETISKGAPASKAYFLGTWMGRVSNLLLLADTAGLTAERDKLLGFVRPVVISSLHHFEYDERQRSLIETTPEFGNEKLNDHHFHYGYFIRAAAVVARFDPSILEEVQDQVQAMVDDVATYDRSSEQYPFLRNFDIYEGHSWADGYAGFGDGNNQESSSEAMHAWYSLYLWSKITQDPELERYALYLFNTEKQSIFAYWFDQYNIYSRPYQHAIASMVWGGKVDFATWFSGETNMIYGIQLLPFSPASGYLRELPDFKKYDTDYHSHGGSELKEWGELFMMWKSFYQPQQMVQMKDRPTKFEAANSRSLFLYILYSNVEKKQ